MTPLIRLLIFSCLLPLAAAQSPSTPREINAATLPGDDAGAQINAADLRLGASAGTILYSGAPSQKASSSVVLHAHHSLVLASPIEWTSTITLPPGSSGQSITCPSLQTLAFPAARTWINAARTSDVSLHDCRLLSTLTSAATVAIGGGAVARLSVRNNTAQDVQIVEVTSTAANYAGVTAENSSSDITVVGNQGHATSGQGIFIHLAYTNRGVITGNTADNFFYGISWWGGDSCLAGCQAGGDGASANPRRASLLTIQQNRIVAKEACIWGSMGQALTISGNTCTSTAPGTGDVGIDLEGTQDSTVTGNTVRGFQNGSLATFFLATRNVWRGNIVENSASEAPIGIHNSSQNPASLIETFADNTFTCARACSTIVEATGVLNLTGNHFTNVFLTTGFNLSHVSILNNFLTELVAVPGGINITSLTAADNAPGKALIRGNQITSNSAQANTASAISVTGTDFNQPQQTLIDRNTFAGSVPFPIDITCSAASGNSAAQANDCAISNNTLASGKIVTTSKPNTAVRVTRTGNRCANNAPC